MQQQFDIVIVGAGLSGCLTALALRASRPNVNVCLLEQAAAPAGNHTWCFHEPDLPQGIPLWLEPAIAWRWRGYDVRFPKFVRQFASAYFGVSSERLREVVVSQLGEKLICGAQVLDLQQNCVTLAGGEKLQATLVLDCRGQFRESPVAYQKFYGLKIRLHKPHGIAKPVIMDATVPQLDGFRFVYVLPLGKQELLVEDTRYSDSATIDLKHFKTEIQSYAAKQGWHVAAELGDEIGALPIPLLNCPQPGRDEVLKLGAAAGLFNAVTGYSFPNAMHTAVWVATHHDQPDFVEKAHAYIHSHWRAGAYLRRLNNMLFLAAKPQQRRNIMERFYEHPTATIERLYSGRLTFKDKVRILCIRPPVTLGAAARAFSGIWAPSATVVS
jgi:lycopene beta-cyclase